VFDDLALWRNCFDFRSAEVNSKYITQTEVKQSVNIVSCGWNPSEIVCDALESRWRISSSNLSGRAGRGVVRFHQGVSYLTFTRIVIS